MWSDRDMEEHSVYDHRNTNGGSSVHVGVGGNGGVGTTSALYASTAAQTLPSAARMGHNGQLGLPHPGSNSIYNGSVYGTLTLRDPSATTTTSTGGASMSGGHMNGVMNGYGPLASIDGSVIDGSSHHLPPPPPPLPPEGTLGATGVGSGNYAAINTSSSGEGHYSRLDYGPSLPAGNGHAVIPGSGDGMVYGVLDGSSSSDGACHVMANMMASPEEFDDETASVSVGGGGGTVYGEIGGHHGHHKSSQGLKESRSHGLMMVYAGRMGLNERGCHVASALSALAFALLVIIVSLAICWPASSLRHTGPLHFCTEPACLEASAGIRSSMNTSVESGGGGVGGIGAPCHSGMWDYACGKWLATNPLPPSRSRWSVMEAADFRARQVKARLIATTSHEPSQVNSIEWKVHNFYASCVALHYIESDHDKPLVKIINQLGGWDVLRSFVLYMFDSTRVLTSLHAKYGVNAFFKIDVIADVKRPGRNVVRIGPGGLGLPHKSYYDRLPDDPAVVSYQTYLKDAAQLFGASSPDAHKFSVDMFSFEKRISEITPDQAYLNNPVRTNNRMTVKELHAKSMNIQWLEILKAAYSDAKMNEDTEVVVVSPQYCSDIGVIMSTTDRASMNNYLMWQLASSFMPYLAKPFREIGFLYKKALTGVQRDLDRWEFCEVTTERFFRHLITSMHAQDLQGRGDLGLDLSGSSGVIRGQTEQAQRKGVAKKLFDYIKHNVMKSVTLSNNYDYPTRRAALDKLKNMTVQLGTPDFLTDKAYLKLMYKDLMVQNTDFFQNILYGVQYLRKWEERALVSPSEETQWLDATDRLQVSYVTAVNRIIVPDLFLRPPLFDTGYPNSVNLGGLGVQVTRAMLSGVIGQGLLFDSNGTLLVQPELPGMTVTNRSVPFVKDYPSSDPRTILAKDTACLLAKVSSLQVDRPDFLAKSGTSIALNVAALKQTFVSLEDVLDFETGMVLPAMETFDPQALFFLTYAQSLCVHRTPQQLDIDRTSSDTLMERQMLEATLTQLPEFHEYFYCSYDYNLDCGSIV